MGETVLNAVPPDNNNNNWSNQLKICPQSTRNPYKLFHPQRERETERDINSITLQDGGRQDKYISWNTPYVRNVLKTVL